MKKLGAVVLGASGSVGSALIEELVRDGTFVPIVTLVRRSQPVREGVRQIVVPSMEPLALEASTREAVESLGGDAVGLTVLGVGAGTGKLTIDQHRAIDVELNAAFARGLKASGRVGHLAFLSAVGADPTAKETGSGAAGMARYARVKGESEEAVQASGIAVVSSFRPATIVGSQHTPWAMDKLARGLAFVTPSRWKPITVAQIARAMVAASRTPPTVSGVYHYREMRSLGA